MVTQQQHLDAVREHRPQCPTPNTAFGALRIAGRNRCDNCGTGRWVNTLIYERFTLCPPCALAHHITQCPGRE